MVPMISTFTPSGITKEQADDINKKLDELESKQLKTEVLFSKVLERENITQDKIDEWMEIIRKLAKKKGLKVD